ncbi:KleE stable inheritance protein [Burkholderia cenocepacia]|uniref:KleE stable inheritance protein n=1 Tax=Burkholderia cenocepacia TaxID=95486 RepID=UPI002ABE8D1B|nr:KleE stable inheritance protein [Burkholderia cenocepacia]
MSKIIKFPTIAGAPKEAVKPSPAPRAEGAGVLAAIIKAVWVVVVLVWPILRWVIALDVVFQLVRMLWLWHTPGAHAGWAFLLHFAVLTALTYFVSLYKPKGL